MDQQEGQQPRRTAWARSILVVVAAAALGASAFAPAASAAPAPTDTTATIPVEAQIVSTGVVQGTPVVVSAQDELVRAQAAGVSAADLAAIANATSCWYWSTQLYYTNIFGKVILRFHVEPNWCTTGYWLTAPVYTNTWADVNVPGWSYEHVLNESWTRYGAGWNIYITHQQGHFCFISYFSCVQNKYPWIEDEVGPGNRVDYFHHGG